MARTRRANSAIRAVEDAFHVRNNIGKWEAKELEALPTGKNEFHRIVKEEDGWFDPYKEREEDMEE
jgi:hypothetical protein